MTLSDLRTALFDLIARTDYTSSKATQHINWGMNRIARISEFPMQEKVIQYTLEDSPSMPVPDDYIGMKYLLVDNTPVQKIDYTQLLKVEQQGNPAYYSRVRNQWEFRPVQEGSEVTCIYTSAWEELVNDDDTNEILTVAPEAVLYAAASYAAIYFMDQRQKDFENRYQMLAIELNDQWNNQEMSTSAPMGVASIFDTADYGGRI